MKKTSLVMTLVAAAMLVCGSISAKRQAVPRMYVFGMAASFTDTIVHITPIQQLDSVWINPKNKFMLEREAYSYQLRDYLSQQEQMPHRTCIVFYAQKREKLEKKYQKMLRLYTKGKDKRQHFDVRYLSDQQFRFHTIDMSEYEDGDE